MRREDRARRPRRELVSIVLDHARERGPTDGEPDDVLTISVDIAALDVRPTASTSSRATRSTPTAPETRSVLLRPRGTRWCSAARPGRPRADRAQSLDHFANHFVIHSIGSTPAILERNCNTSGASLFRFSPCFCGSERRLKQPADLGARVVDWRTCLAARAMGDSARRHAPRRAAAAVMRAPARTTTSLGPPCSRSDSRACRPPAWPP